MYYYVRKINRAKWNISENLRGNVDINQLNADYLSSCLKTQQGEISLWKINNETEIDDVVVAITSVGDCIDKVDLILLKEEELSSIGLTPINKPEGNTKIKDKHYQISNLNYEKVGNMAKVIFEKIENDNSRYKRITASETKKLLKNAITTGDLILPNNSKLLEKLDA